tara:strand:+ start:4018 stop:4644 length:627 start_codon:yes stop_codon:yes gene_type:complete
MTDDGNRGLIGALQHIAQGAPDDGLTLGEFTDALDERAFGVILFALALPVCIPFLYVIPQIVALPMLAVAAQMAAGRGEPWMPRKFAERRIDKPALERMARTGKRWFGWLEVIARPRLHFLSGPTGERVVGAFLCLFCASVLVPLPLTNTTPGIATAIASLGLLTRDGFLILFGLLMGTAWILLLAVGGPALLYAIIDFVRGLVNGGA